MNSHITPRIELLVSGQSYKTVWTNKSPHLKGKAAGAANGSGYYWPMPIYTFQVLDNDETGTMDIWTWSMNLDAAGITVPKAAFLVGHTYEMYLTKFIATGITLLGYHTRNMPFELNVSTE